MADDGHTSIPVRKSEKSTICVAAKLIGRNTFGLDRLQKINNLDEKFMHTY